MAVAVGAQAIDLAQPPPFHGHDPLLLEDAGLINENHSLNYPWIIAMSAMIGNAATVGLARMANVFCEPEWGFEGTGVGAGRNYTGAGGRSAVGGMNIWW